MLPGASMHAARMITVLAGAGSLLVCIAGCSSPTKPSVSVASARPVSPAGGTQISYYSQPITLIVGNGVATGSASPITTVEVATDAAFTATVATQSVSPGANGQLTITLGHLNPVTTYYWRVKTAAGDNPGVYSSSASFSIGPLLVIQPPTPVQPLADSFPHKRPTFTVTNAVRTGPAATLMYRFEVAADAAFGNIVATGIVPEGGRETSFTPTVDLVPGSSYVWRAEASDTAKAVTSGYSAPQPFTTVNPDDGSYRYTLVLYLPPACYIGHPFRSTHYDFDNALVVSGENLRFVVSNDASFPGHPLDLEIARTGNHLAGTIGGGAGWGFVLISAFGAVAGSADSNGHFTGTLDGEVTEDTPALQEHICAAPGLTWTLTPH
jgi:hypothetical protein